ncbi:hypothetical protein [Azospirillum sp. TSO22-1]|uniref:hypothetical protein n=1 Tax=Azospirillum sp. TSO22-1 TaxID=716789 RepID=UPI000D60B684|nr:hypothetical protein [Azospirillum sp. TSO22-1]PWC44288.1 hypothetical protein TSO221_18530 [Azospirillum sp. TSO22-1]
MTHDDFLALLDAHGSDLSLWPVPARAAAERLLESSDEAAAAWRAARAVERLLAEPPQVSDERVGRLLAAVARQAGTAPRETFLVLLFGRMPARLAGALCAGLLALGWLAGGLTIGPAPSDGVLLAEDVPSLFDGGPR